MRKHRNAPQRGTYILGAILDIGKSIAGNMFAEEQQEDQQVFNATQAAIGRTFNAEEAAKQRGWSTAMSSSAYQRAVADLNAAGLNPILAAYHGGGSATPAGATASGATGSSGIAQPATGHSIAAGMQSASQAELNQAAEERTRAEAKKAEAETEEIRARTPTHAVSIEKMRQDMAESAQRINRILAEIPTITQQGATSAAQAQHYQQQIKNLIEQIPVLRENVNQLRALTNLNKAQAMESGARTTVSDATYDEIRQRTRENLPEMERRLKELEEKAHKLSMPARTMDSVTSNSFIGAFRAAVRAWTGQQAILGR